MKQTLIRRALVAATVLSFAAGCSGDPLASSQSSSVTPSLRHFGGAVRILPGPVVSGPIVVPLVPAKLNAPIGWPKKKKQKAILFVADTSGVLMYDPNTPNGSPTGSITTGTDDPFGVAVDKAGTLYVANIGNSSVTVYPSGDDSPSLTITSGVDSPYSVTVDSKGNVFVSNLGNNTITAYATGQTTPYESISFASYGQAVGLDVDGLDNVWVACDSSNGVFEIKAGSSGVTNSGLTGLSGPIGVSFGKKDEIFVANFGATDVSVYKYGSTTSSEIISNGIAGPTQNGITSSDLFFQTNQDDNVVGYKKGQTTPFSTLSGATSAAQIASSPLVKK